MADLDAWVQAQQKRGYSRQQINAYLAKRGYPASAVAQAGKMAPSKTIKITGRQSKALLAIAAIVAIGLLVLWLADSLRSTQRPEAQQPGKQQLIAANMAEAAVKGFIKGNLKKELWPDSFEPVPGLTSRGSTGAREGYYGLAWEKGGSKFFAQTFFEQDSALPEFVRLTAATGHAASDASQLGPFLSSLMRKSPVTESFACEQQKTFELPADFGTFTTSLFCNYVKVGKENEKTIVTAVTAADTTSLYICEFTEGSVSYNATNCYRFS